MRARLLNPERVTIQPINRADTREDALAGEPYARLERDAAIVVMGQVDELDRQRRTPGQGGANLPARISVTFLKAGTRRPDGVHTGLAATGWTPTAGDRVTGLADEDGANPRALSLFVAEAHASGKERRRARLVVVMLEGRAPSRPGTEGGL